MTTQATATLGRSLDLGAYRRQSSDSQPVLRNLKGQPRSLDDDRGHWRPSWDRLRRPALRSNERA